MNSKQQFRNIIILLVGLFFTGFNGSYGQKAFHNISIPSDRNIYLNPELGSDINSGTKESPLRSLFEAARRVNEANGKGAINIYPFFRHLWIRCDGYISSCKLAFYQNGKVDYQGRNLT